MDLNQGHFQNPLRDYRTTEVVYGNKAIFLALLMATLNVL